MDPRQLILATITLTITTLADLRPRLAAPAAVGVMLLIPAGLQAYAFYRPFLHAYNPHHAILPLQSAWHVGALARYPALLATLGVTGAAALTAIGLTYVHVQQRRGARTMTFWPHGRRSLRPIPQRPGARVG